MFIIIRLKKYVRQNIRYIARHRGVRRERRVASVRTLALIRVASLVARAASKHSLESSGARRRKGPVHKYWRAL